MKKIIIIGAGFTALSAAKTLSNNGYKPLLIDSSADIGGLASGFKTNNDYLEKFYHHWFNSDKYILSLIKDLNLENNLIYLDSKTGMYFNDNFFKLSTPIDLLKFNAVSFISRLRLGFLVLYVRFIRNYKKLEKISAKNWLTKLVGKQAYKVVWEPLLVGKFGPYANKVAAVWFWNKLSLRGGTRGKNNAEQLLYFKGGFVSLIKEIESYLRKKGTQFNLKEQVVSIKYYKNKVVGVQTSKNFYKCDVVLCTTALPIYKKLISTGNVTKKYISSLDKIKYIGNVCLILELDRSLSNYYWLNVNDPSFPFVGIIEHTNFIDKSHYGNRHIIYVSKYLPVSDKLFSLKKDEYLNFAVPFIKKMFPNFDKSWIKKSHIWKSEFSQPVVTKNYRNNIPDSVTPIKNLYLSTMAQIYPQDRGTNYAIKYGDDVAKKIIMDIKK